MSDSICRQNNWSVECENLLNEQINLEHMAFYQYLALYSYFNRDNISLQNTANFFLKASNEEKEHAEKLIQYQLKRGGKVVFKTISPPAHEWENQLNKTDILYSFEEALFLEQKVYEHLLKLHEIADPQFADYLESEFLEEQIDAMNELGHYIAQLKRIGSNGHGILYFDKMLK